MEELKSVTVYAVGDSTVSAFSDGYYLPRYGYGTQLGNYLRPQARVVNLALSGRSSKSFLSEENYALLLSSLKEGDFLVIGFGHNDQKGEDARYTNANLGIGESDPVRGVSFKDNLYKNYILPALSRGATPVLCTPVVRLSNEGDYTASCGHITGSNGKFEGGDYPRAVRELGAEVGVTVLDLTAATIAEYKKIGFARASDYHAWASTCKGVRSGLDCTHFNKYGAKFVAYEWARLLAASRCPLKKYLKPQILPPGSADYDDAINSDYKEPQYAPFNAATDVSARHNVAPPWYGTVMGDFGGEEHIADFTVIGRGADFAVGNDSSVVRGKISKDSDGFAAAFMQLPAGKNFTARARAKVKNLRLNDAQSAFGLMLRDDILIDEYRPAENANFVASGYCGGNALFCREGGALQGFGAANLSSGAEYALTITKINQQISVECNGFIKSFFDFDLVSVDNDFVYICLFANRGITVEFSGVWVEITGDSVGA